MLGLLFQYQKKKFKRYFSSKLSAKLVTAVLFLVILLLIAFGIYLFFREGLAYINHEIYFRKALSLYAKVRNILLRKKPSLETYRDEVTLYIGKYMPMYKDLRITFAAEMGSLRGRMREKSIGSHVVYIMLLRCIPIMMAGRKIGYKDLAKFLAEYKQTFIHEATHYFDFKEGVLKSAKGHDSDKSEEDRIKRHNSSAEFNAYYQDGASRIYQSFRIAMRETQHHPDWPVPSVEEWLEGGSYVEFKRKALEQFRQGWLEILTDENREKMDDRLKYMWKKLFEMADKLYKKVYGKTYVRRYYDMKYGDME